MEQYSSGVGVLDKSLLVLEAVEHASRTLAELVDATGLSRATAHRLAGALVDHGLLRRDRDGRYLLGLRLVAFGNAANASFPLSEAATPVLRDLRDATGESVQLYVTEPNGRRCVVAFSSPHELRTIVEPGALLPLERGSAGRVLLGDPLTGEGWIESVAGREAGVASVSAPVYDGAGDVIAALSVSGPIDRVGTEPGRRFGALVVAAAATCTFRV